MVLIKKYIVLSLIILCSIIIFSFKALAEPDSINLTKTSSVEQENKEPLNAIESDINVLSNQNDTQTNYESSKEITNTNEDKENKTNQTNEDNKSETILKGFESVQVKDVKVDNNRINITDQTTTQQQTYQSIIEGKQDLSGFQILDVLTYEELKSLGRYDVVPEELQKKVDIILNTPIVDNTISKNTDTIINSDETLGEFIRVACWNIERGLDLDGIKEALLDPDQYISLVPNAPAKKIDIVKKQIEDLKNADIILLNEVDMGMPRTDYRNIAKEFAEIFGYNYAYGVEFLEVDPARFGEDITEWSEERIVFKDKEFNLIPEKFKGMHGTAIISRFKLKNVRIVRLPQAYDWFNSEKKELSGLEIEKRLFARNHLQEHILREIRLGGRMALIADVDIPHFEKPVTIIAAHLENRARPHERKKQILFLLKQVKDIDNPIIFGGDFNTSGHDASPLILSKEIKEFLLSLLNPVKAVEQFLDIIDFGLYYIEDFIGIFYQHVDPTQVNIPIFNHNAERKVFKAIQHFKFDDKHIFDFRGTRYFSHQKRGRLSHSSQRCWTGFKPTYQLSKKFYRSKFKLDWIFVKSFLTEQKTEKEKYKFAPLFGKVYFDFTYYNKKEPLSDHAPISVDLPLKSPSMPKK